MLRRWRVCSIWHKFFNWSKIVSTTPRLFNRYGGVLKIFIFNLGKTYIIILIALGVSSTSKFSLRTLTEVTTDGVASLMVGENDVDKCIMKSTSSLLGCKIDKSLTVAQASMAFINQIDTAENPNLAAQVERAKLFADAGVIGRILKRILLVFKQFKLTNVRRFNSGILYNKK